MTSSLTGSTTTSAEVPEYLDQAMQDLLTRANQTASIGYMANPNAGVAAFTPMQVSAMEANNGAMQAYGLGGVDDVMAGMPQAKNLGGGVMGYRSAPGYNKAKQDFRQQNPGQQAAYNQLFVDPKGNRGGNGQGAAPGNPNQPQGEPNGNQGQPMLVNGQWQWSNPQGARK